MKNNSENIPPTTPEAPFDYEIMTPQPSRTEVKTLKAYHEKYIGLLSSLVEDAVGDPDSRADAIVFLDKSARPLAWMMSELWDDIAPQEKDPETGEIRTIKKPAFKFANIDRLHWRNDFEEEMVDGGAKPIDDDDIQGLRDIFHLDKKKPANRPQETLDGKKIYIVDEQIESGDTLTISMKLFKVAFPDATVRGGGFVKHPYKENLRTGKRDYRHNEIPPWYPLKLSNLTSDDETGRGVYSPIPYERRSERFRNKYEKRSNGFLTTRPYELVALSDAEFATELSKISNIKDPEERAWQERQLLQREKLVYKKDAKSEILRKEIARIALDFRRGVLFPAIVSDRQEIAGLKADDYYKKATNERSTPTT